MDNVWNGWKTNGSDGSIASRESSRGRIAHAGPLTSQNTVDTRVNTDAQRPEWSWARRRGRRSGSSQNQRQLCAYGSACTYWLFRLLCWFQPTASSRPTVLCNKYTSQPSILYDYTATEAEVSTLTWKVDTPANTVTDYFAIAVCVCMGLCVYTHIRKIKKRRRRMENMSSMMPVRNTFSFFFLPFFWFSALCPIHLDTDPVGIINTSSNTHHLHWETQRPLASAFAKQLREANPYHRRSFNLGFYWMRHLGRGGRGINGSFKVLLQIMMPKCF